MLIHFDTIDPEGKEISTTGTFHGEDGEEYLVEAFTGVIYPVNDTYFLDGTLNLCIREVCDRCAEQYETRLTERIQMEIVPAGARQLTEEEMELSDDDAGVTFAPADHVNLHDVLLQESRLLRPMKHVCSDDCRGLCAECGANLNTESCSCDSAGDPRFSALKNLKQ